MADGQLNTNEQPPQRTNNRTIFYIVLLLLLVGINVYLYIKYNQKSTRNQELIEKTNDDSTRLADLDMKFQEALVNIESYKGQNAQLDSIIAVKEKALMDLKKSYSSLQRNKKLSDAEYKQQVDNLNSLLTELQTQVSQLEQQNKVLINRNDSLGRSLAAEITTSTELTTTNKQLSKKVSMASLLKPTTISATGARSKSNGKEDETSSAKRAEKLKACWDVPANDVADPGQKMFYVRFISPEGITLALESSGSGVINKADTGDPVQYSTTVTVDYDGTKKSVCAYWQQTAPYAKGSYTAEIYQDGYLIATQQFELD